MRAGLPVVSFVCLVLVLIPLPRYWRARNIPVLSTIAWLALCNLGSGVNSIVWAGNTAIRLQVWCDITTKITIGASIGLSAALVCICRLLSQVASPRHTTEDPSVKPWRRIFELVMCVGLPLIIMTLHVIVQGNRFLIIEDVGCQPFIYISIPAVFIIYVPPLVLSAAVIFYAGLAFRWFVYRRNQFKTVLQSSRSGLTTRRYFRLIALCITETLCVVGMSIFALASNVHRIGLQPWVSWDFVHANWRDISQTSRLDLSSADWSQILAIWFIFPVCSVVFFVFFGFGAEANAEYLKAVGWIKTNVFRMKSEPSPVLPVSARVAPPSSNPMMTTPAIVKLETLRTVSGGAKWDGAPTPAYTAYRPASPHDKSVAESETSSRTTLALPEVLLPNSQVRS